MTAKASVAGKRPFRMIAGVSSLTDLVDGLGFGVGNVYIVVQAANTAVYLKVWDEYQRSYADGSMAVHTTIQSALDATVANRNDYVVVMPDSSNYTLTTALTMTKKAVHLICPAGITGQPGSTNAARVYQTGAYNCLTLSGQGCEVAGIWFKCAADKGGIDISAGAHACNIHDNFFALATTDGAADMYGIHGTGESSNLIIANNYVTNYSPVGTSKTVGGGIVLANGTRALIKNNLVTTGGFGTTLSIGIGCGGAQVICIGNWIIESKSGNPASSTLSIGISASNDTVLIENRVSMAVANIANAISGMHADCAVMNYGTDASGGDTILA